jgi:site-specific DNA-methyltransferase (adenine-specific)
MGKIDLLLGDCLERMRELPDGCVDAIVTDPPYGLSFMGKKWDYDVPSVEIWAECLRVLKPGGYLLAFAGTRTQHRMAVRIEDAGFEIRDMIAWVYGSGFPKSLDVSKAIDKAAGAEREVVSPNPNHRAISGVGYDGVYQGGNTGAASITSPATEAAQQWDGWGTALKPALEPITVARKPLIGTVAANVLAHGTGAINVDRCRVGNFVNTTPSGVDRRNAALAEAGYRPGQYQMGQTTPNGAQGRWPANLIHDGSQMVLDLFPEANSARANGNPNNPKRGTNHIATSYGQGDGKVTHDYRDTGSAARFFYCAKTSKKDRDEGLTNDPQAFVQFQTANGTSGKPSSLSEGRDTQYRNTHPTVKPTDLMRYLCRLVTQPGGIILDPFMGSGSTGKAAKREGFGFIGIERDETYFEIAKRRIDNG